ncbi:MAG: Glu/Leu/Phe/Val dehydrogenase dimerization domain-containing protein [Pseudomonadota bacterium]
MFRSADFDAHEEVVFATDAMTGLRAILAIHNTSRGPALGGCRAWTYETDDAAVSDVLRLSRGMTYKNALADLPLGGGKSVCLLPTSGERPHDLSAKAMFESLGAAIDRLGGRYITAEDVGTKPADMLAIRRHTKHAAGIPPEHGGYGDPSPFTARGCFNAVKAAACAALNKSDLKGVHVALQGLGNVGYRLAEHLAQAGARLTVCDINGDAIERAERELGAAVVGTDEIHRVDADIFSPNALGASLNADTIPELRVGAIAGGANNQLATNANGEQLAARGILYAPDYAVNAGGVILICGEYYGWERADIDRRVDAIEARLVTIFERAKADGAPTSEIADAMAEAKFQVRRAR